MMSELEVIKKLIVSAQNLMEFREHARYCEIDTTDFCTCGMAHAAVEMRLAILDGQELVRKG